MGSDQGFRSNAAALEATLEALRDLGRLEPVDSARVEIARGLARAVDDAPGNAALWREFRAAEATLREIRDTDGDDMAELESYMRAPLGDGSESA